ncbi:hypothetical protein Emag_004075 [Eimeria magna]
MGDAATAASRLWDFWRSDFCLGILPALKAEVKLAKASCKQQHRQQQQQQLQQDQKQQQQQQQQDKLRRRGHLWTRVLDCLLRDLVALLHPFAPFVSEAISLALQHEAGPSSSSSSHQQQQQQQGDAVTCMERQTAQPLLCRPWPTPLDGQEDVAAERAFLAARAAVSLIRRALHSSRSLGRSTQPAAAAAGCNETTGPHEQQQQNSVAASIFCSDDEALEALRKERPLLAELCGLSVESMSLAQLARRGGETPREETGDTCCLSKTFLLPRPWSSSSREDEPLSETDQSALTIEVLCKGAKVISGQQTPQSSQRRERRQLSLKRKLQHLERRMSNPDFEARAPLAIRQKLTARLREIEESLKAVSSQKQQQQQTQQV